MKGNKKHGLIFVLSIVLVCAWCVRYRTINQDYQKRWATNTEKTYSLGETVPVASDYLGYGITADGYMITVNDFDIVDYSTYASTWSYDDTDRSRIPDKVALVDITISQQNSTSEGFPLTELSLYTLDLLMNMDWDLLDMVNPVLKGNTGIHLENGATCDIVLPFDLYKYRFSSTDWRNLEQSNIWLQITNYPTRKNVIVNTEETMQ